MTNRSRTVLAGALPRGRLRQEDYFRLPKLPPNSLPAIRDSLSGVLERKAQTMNEQLAANAATRDSIARESAKRVTLKTTRDRANARRAEARRDSLSRELDRKDELLRAGAEQDTLHYDSV